MSKSVLRTVLTILMYVGVLVFFVPYISGKAGGAMYYHAGGAIAAVVFGMLRCFWTEEDECWWHVRS